MQLVPFHQSLLNYWKSNKETDQIKKAGRFLFLSNYTYIVGGNTLLFQTQNQKKIILERVCSFYDFLSDAKFMNFDFRDVLKRIAYREFNECLVYADPTYLNSDHKVTDKYECKWAEKDTYDLFEILTNSGLKFAISEFDNPFILDLAKKNNLYVSIIGERLNLKNRRTEVLVTNYNTNKNTLF
jgi:DNA adenine methylase